MKVIYSFHKAKALKENSLGALFFYNVDVRCAGRMLCNTILNTGLRRYHEAVEKGVVSRFLF